MIVTEQKLRKKNNNNNKKQNLAISSSRCGGGVGGSGRSAGLGKRIRVSDCKKNKKLAQGHY